jgi:hypothetical protein
LERKEGEFRVKEFILEITTSFVLASVTKFIMADLQLLDDPSYINLHADIKAVINHLSSFTQDIAVIAANIEHIAQGLCLSKHEGAGQHDIEVVTSALSNLLCDLRQHTILHAAACKEGLTFLCAESSTYLGRSSFRIIMIWFAMASISGHRGNLEVIEQVSESCYT